MRGGGGWDEARGRAARVGRATFEAFRGSGGGGEKKERRLAAGRVRLGKNDDSSRRGCEIGRARSGMVGNTERRVWTPRRSARPSGSPRVPDPVACDRRRSARARRGARRVRARTCWFVLTVHSAGILTSTKVPSDLRCSARGSPSLYVTCAVLASAPPLVAAAGLSSATRALRAGSSRACFGARARRRPCSPPPPPRRDRPPPPPPPWQPPPPSFEPWPRARPRAPRGAALPAHRDRGRSETERSTRRARARVSDRERTRRRTARGGKNGRLMASF